MSDLPLAQLCGQLLVGGFLGTDLPASFAAALARGERAGAILFRRNLEDLGQTAELCSTIWAAAPSELPPIVGVDQEGGRVARLPAPFFALPPMARLGQLDDPDLTFRLARTVGVQLRALGFSLDFAPVLDVGSNPDNPVIGDRSFGPTPELVVRHGLAFARGLAHGGVGACGKHFPGHGDTSRDSHLELPFVEHDLARLRALELVPFAAAAAAGLPALMSAHVVFRALDAERPATLSPALCTELLRRELGFCGVLFSDDLEMGAIGQGFGIEQAAIQAVAAGCDLLLICRDEALQERAHAALVRQAEQDARFAARCREAVGRSLDMRRRAPRPPRAGEGTRPWRSEQQAAIVQAFESDAVLALGEELARRLEASKDTSP